MYHLLVLSEFICLPKGSVCWSVFLGTCATAVCSDISFFQCLNVLTCWQGGVMLRLRLWVKSEQSLGVGP